MSRVGLWCEIVCSDCARTTAGRFTYGQPPRRRMYREAMRDGWIFEHDESFCSPSCMEGWERNNAFSLREPEP